MTTLLHPAAKPDCPVCHGLGLRIVRDGVTAVARRCTCLAEVCPICQGTGYHSDSTAFRAPVTRCVHTTLESRGHVFDAAGIPARYATATLGTFDPRRGGMAAHMQVRKYVSGYQPGEMNRGLVLYGPVGRGKTHLVIAAARELILRHGVTARFVEFSHLLADLKLSFGRNGATAEILEPLTATEILVVDELGKGRNTEFEGTVLDELVSRRYNAGATILGTTNFEPGASTGRHVANLADPGGATPALIDRVGERVYSRIYEICDFVPVDGEDQRVVNRHAARKRGRD